MKYPEDKLNQDIQTLDDLVQRLHDIVWEPQEGQKDHFDNIQKTERVAIIGVYNDAVSLKDHLVGYRHWFSPDRKRFE